MQPKDVVRAWVKAFNRADVDALVSLYEQDAINHQVAEAPVQGRAAIGEMLRKGFVATKMVCIVENLFQDGEWAIVEWRDPLGLRGCGFFQVHGDRIAFQRGYWDKRSFAKSHGIPLEA
jgi:limonene-1,2-epoxide hydrolase